MPGSGTLCTGTASAFVSIRGAAANIARLETPFACMTNKCTQPLLFTGIHFQLFEAAPVTGLLCSMQYRMPWTAVACSTSRSCHRQKRSSNGGPSPSAWRNTASSYHLARGLERPLEASA